MTSKSEIESRIRGVATNASKFKIGKTGKTIEERLSDYNYYDKIKSVYSSTDPKKVSALEEEMIKNFINWRANMNKDAESYADMASTGHYKVYVVYNLG